MLCQCEDLYRSLVRAWPAHKLLLASPPAALSPPAAERRSEAAVLMTDSGPMISVWWVRAWHAAGAGEAAIAGRSPRCSTDHDDGAAPGLGGSAEDVVEVMHQGDAKETGARADPGHRDGHNGGAACEA